MHVRLTAVRTPCYWMCFHVSGNESAQVRVAVVQLLRMTATLTVSEHVSVRVRASAHVVVLSSRRLHGLSSRVAGASVLPVWLAGFAGS